MGRVNRWVGVLLGAGGLLPFWPLGLNAASQGRAGFLYLKSTPYARSAGMAEATTAFVGNPLSFYSNPAGLAHMAGTEVGVQHSSHFQDALYENVAFAIPTVRGGWGITAGAFSVRDIPRTRFDASVADRFVESGKVTAADYDVSCSWARRQTGRLALGATLRVVRETLDSESAVSVMTDLGGIYRWDEQWRVAAVIQNMGTPAKFISEQVSPPTRARFAVYWAPRAWAVWEADAIYNFQADPEALAGLEVNWYHVGFFRAGYRYANGNAGLGALAGASFGAGLEFRSMRLDYAFLPFQDLGDSQQISFSWRFSSLE